MQLKVQKDWRPLSNAIILSKGRDRWYCQSSFCIKLKRTHSSSYNNIYNLYTISINSNITIKELRWDECNTICMYNYAIIIFIISRRYYNQVRNNYIIRNQINY